MPCRTYRADTSRKLREMPKNIIEGYLSWARDQLARWYCLFGPSSSQKPKTRGEKKDKTVTDTVADVQYEDKESQDDQIDIHQDVDTVDDNELDTDWRDNVNIGAQYASHC